MRPEDAPVLRESSKKPVPVERRPAREEQVRDVGAIEAFSLHHERLRPDRFLWRAKQDGYAEDRARRSVRKPLRIDSRGAVARVVDDVEKEVLVVMRLRQPMRVGHARMEAGALEDAENAGNALTHDEYVEVLRRPADGAVRDE